ncbi:MAG: phosphoglycerate dehydrogenase [Clostridia bacterium]|nr:phosphoglycerate dehydrogenase [Clostridia bacterium]
MNIKLMNKIAPIGIEKFGSGYTIGTDVQDPDGILVRSAPLHDMAFNPELKAIARAGAGVNNIPIDRCSENGIVVFNTPGANANAVKELVLCGLMLSSRDIIQGSQWVSGLKDDIAAQVEKGKGQFAGTEIYGKTLGVIGLGAIGRMVANTAVHLGMEIIGCDPYLSVEGAWNLNHHVRHAANYDEVFEKCDYITLHVPSNPSTRGMLNEAAFAKMKDGVRILNFARGDLVDASALKAALASGKVARYVTDFPSDDIINTPGIVAIPHLGASTEESEDNCAVMASLELKDYLENGNITNSVNYPNVSMPRSGDMRICVFNSNVPDVLSGISAVLSSQGVNIENLTNKSRGSNAYTVIDISGKLSESEIDRIRQINGVIRVRVIG